ncbi:MAG: NAD/NADP octopine/nopaline dehydrogenase family protein [Prevotella sp.]|nr:NAD/NADP octopine/nopaline dehydrogenase family protein [Prevotella sp.]
MKVCICGGGNLGHVVAGFLAAYGDCEVSLLTRHPERWQQQLEIMTPEGGILQGCLKTISSDPMRVVSPADIVLLCLPGFSIREVLQQIAPALTQGTAVGSIVCSTGFFFEAFRILPSQTPLFGFQRVPFISRIKEYGCSADLLGYKPNLNIAIEQTSEKEALRADIERLFRVPVQLLASYYEVSLTNSNPLLHPARLYSLWKDWHEGMVYPKESLFYEEWTTEASDYLIRMDEEFQQLLNVLPVTKGSIPSILDYYESTDALSLTHKLQSIQAFKGIKSPMKKVEGGYMPDFNSRYFTEDFPYGLQIVQQQARQHGISTPVIDKILRWGMTRLAHERFNPEGSLLRRQQMRMLDILIEVDKICKRHGIQYWLSSGTLIGAIRHNGFIPWDDDLDIEMMRSDYVRLMEVLPKELPSWLALQNDETDENYFYFYAKVRDRRSRMLEQNGYDRLWKEQGIYIDIFPMEQHPIRLHKLTENTVGHMYKIWRTSTDDTKSMRKVRRIFNINKRVVFPCLRQLCKLLPGKVITSGMGIPFHNPRFADEIFPLTTHEFEGIVFPVPNNTDAHLRHIFGDYMQLPDLDKLSPHVDKLEFYD